MDPVIFQNFIDQVAESSAVKTAAEPQPIQLKKVSRECEFGCGKSLCKQIVNLRFSNHPKPHWKIQCKNCGRYRAPDKVTLVDSNAHVQNLYMRYYNTTKQALPGSQPAPASEITVYHENHHTRKHHWLLSPDGQLTYQDDSASKE